MADVQEGDGGSPAWSCIYWYSWDRTLRNKKRDKVTNKQKCCASVFWCFVHLKIFKEHDQSDSIFLGLYYDSFHFLVSVWHIWMPKWTNISQWCGKVLQECNALTCQTIQQIYPAAFSRNSELKWLVLIPIRSYTKKWKFQTKVEFLSFGGEEVKYVRCLNSQHGWLRQT